MRGGAIGEKLTAMAISELVVGAGASSAFPVPAMGEIATANQPPPTDRRTAPTADIEYTCNNVTITVDPHGSNILFTSVEVVVNGQIIAIDYILARCTPETSERTRSERSRSGTDCGVVAVSDRSRNPVPVAIATTWSSGEIAPDADN